MRFNKKILVCPLDWGLGHATRCVPIIQALLNEGAEVLVAADGAPLALLREEFPELKFIAFQGYRIHYSKRMSMTVSMLLQSPKIIFNIFLEHRRLKSIISDNKIDCVISDNRYGLWNKRIHTVFITHQLSIKCPPSLRFPEPLLNRINHFFINKFDECWVPDSEGENNLSGELSHGVSLHKPATYVGLLSRFDLTDQRAAQMKYELMAIISGPEPHRSLLLENVRTQFKNIKLPSLIVSGEPQKDYDSKINEHVRLVSHLNAAAMREAIMQSKVIVCRAGYSGIMDLVSFKKKAILIPTPGQTEQEYLAEYLKQRKIFYSVRLEEFNIETALKENQFGDFSKTGVEKSYLTAIKRLLAKINA